MVYRSMKNEDEIVDGQILTRICTKCKERQTIENFYLCSGGKYRRRICKTCNMGRATKRRNERKDIGEYHNIFYRENYLRRKYGITVTQLEKLLDEQGGKCAICGRELDTTISSNVPGKMQIDHDHETGRVRGLLCFCCNTGIGKFKDSKELMKKAIDYLDDPPDILYRNKSLSELEVFEHYKNNGKKYIDYETMNIIPVNRAMTRGFTKEEKQQIIDEYFTGEVSQSYLSIKWTTSQQTIHNIIREKYGDGPEKMWAFGEKKTL